MANLEEWQILENDIDWYCLVNGRPTHIASMGGMIPEQFRDSEQLWSNQTTVAKIEPFAAHLQSSVFKLSKDLIDSIHEEGIVAYTS